ncbi:MAG: hypothetical protein ABJP45_03960 [Cyclobacteriaceae bacterium]
MNRVKPDDIFFFFCLPSSKNDFFLDFENPNKHFVKDHLWPNRNDHCGSETLQELWDCYYRQVLHPYLKLASRFKDRGFHFMEKVTFHDFARNIKLDKGQISILFSHSPCLDFTEYIEFHDSLITHKEIVDLVNPDQEGVFDLAVCNPKMLCKALKIERPKLIVKSSNKLIDLDLWLYIYACLFSIIELKKHSYIDAFKLCIEKIRQGEL